MVVGVVNKFEDGEAFNYCSLETGEEIFERFYPKLGLIQEGLNGEKICLVEKERTQEHENTLLRSPSFEVQARARGDEKVIENSEGSASNVDDEASGKGEEFEIRNSKFEIRRGIAGL